METIQVDTNIHCEKCIDKLKPHFDNAENITSWKVDLMGPIKKLSVRGEGLSVESIADLLDKEGYEIVHTQKKKSISFWGNKVKWKRASFNTINCLIGCSIGDFGMIFFLQAYYPETSMMWQMVLAIIAGLFTSILLETFILKIREGFNWMSGLKIAFGMSFVSMVGMEIAMNSTDFLMTGGKAAFDDPIYWTALAIAMIAGFIFPLPYNYYNLVKYDKACH